MNTRPETTGIDRYRQSRSSAPKADMPKVCSGWKADVDLTRKVTALKNVVVMMVQDGSGGDKSIRRIINHRDGPLLPTSEQALLSAR